MNTRMVSKKTILVQQWTLAATKTSYECHSNHMTHPFHNTLNQVYCRFEDFAAPTREGSYHQIKDCKYVTIADVSDAIIYCSNHIDTMMT